MCRLVAETKENVSSRLNFLYLSRLGGKMSKSNKSTGKKAATASSKVLGDGRTADDSKSAAGSALSQAVKSPNKTTGKKAASSASDVLQSGDTGDKSKTAAASALSQTQKKKS